MFRWVVGACAEFGAGCVAGWEAELDPTCDAISVADCISNIGGFWLSDRGETHTLTYDTDCVLVLSGSHWT